MNETSLLVFLSPSVTSQMIRNRKIKIMQATEAGNETELRDMRECVPKQTAITHTIPSGTYSQAVTRRYHVDLKTYEAVVRVRVRLLCSIDSDIPGR